MTRPKKQTVDFFPHTVEHGRTMYILERNYGMHGYYFWYRLLELLGSSEGHYLDCNDDETLEYLLARTRSRRDNYRPITDTLAKMNAIDPELWKNNVIWCQNFVDRLGVLYSNRRVDKPQKPSIYIQESGAIRITTDRKPVKERITTRRKPQSKVKESKVKESKVDNNLPDWLPEKAWHDYIDMRKNIKSPMTDRAKELAIKKLEIFKDQGHDVVEIINNSIMNSWKGLFLTDEQRGKDGKTDKGGNKKDGKFTGLDEKNYHDEAF